jgi:hypothetical protein
MSVDEEPRCHIGPVQAGSEMNLKEAIERVMAIGDLCSDVFFASDIFVQFHTAEWVVSTVGRPHFRLRHSLREIRASYMRSTFVFDVLGIIPVQYVDCVFEPGTLPSGIKALHLVRLIKLLRLYRIRKLIKVRASPYFTIKVWDGGLAAFYPRLYVAGTSNSGRQRILNPKS